jgi:dUTP pyrophosphatase
MRSIKKENMIKVKKEHPDAIIPTRANNNDAGADLYSVVDVKIPPLSRVLVSTGISIQLPTDNLYARVAPRSGLAVKYGIDVLAGVIDNGYRGIVGVVLFNTDKDNTFEVKKGDRIAQLIIENYHPLFFSEVDNLNESDRGNNGFGSSGT